MKHIWVAAWLMVGCAPAATLAPAASEPGATDTTPVEPARTEASGRDDPAPSAPTPAPVEGWEPHGAGPSASSTPATPRSAVASSPKPSLEARDGLATCYGPNDPLLAPTPDPHQRSPQEIREVVRRHREQVRWCLRHGRSTAATGIDLSFTIAASGRVLSAEASDALPDQQRSCLVHALKRMRFRKLMRSAGSTVVRYPTNVDPAQ